ncbi:MAG: DUF11 domain-containing protein [Flavobacteriales bacterium]|nr:DUF11 domain-containing protein [Flavobacteriales bacterium]
MSVTLRSVATVALCAASVVVSAQGETCATAVALTGSGAYIADGPASGNGYVPSACANWSAVHADWYVYTPSFTGVVNIRSRGGADTRFTVFTGACGSLTCIAFADDECPTGTGGANFASETTISVVAGNAYFIQWDDRWTVQGFTWEIDECFGSVQGTTYRDQNTNGVFDVGELLEPVMLDVSPGGGTEYSDGNPYGFCSDGGSFTITPLNPPQYHTIVPPSHSYTITGQGQLADSMDFAFQPIPGIYDGTINLWGTSPWIGNNTNMWITYCNEGTEILDGTVLLSLDPNLAFVSSVPAPGSINGQNISWTFTGLMPGACTTINAIVHTDSTVVAGALLSSSVQLILLQSDIHISDNLDQVAGSAVTSVDPNEKYVSTAFVTPAEVLAGKALEYTVVFQNTGTAPAVNIVVRDTLDADLYLGTFEMIGATHPYTLQVSNGVAIWSFAGIMLPDSTTDEPASHGGIHYRITPKTSLVLGDEVSNRADIYFDYNAPVLTNTVVTTVSEASAVASVGQVSGITAYPLPTTGLLNVLWNGSSVRNVRVELLDAMGRAVLSTSVASIEVGKSATFDLGALVNGRYLLRMTTSEESRTVPVVVAH